MDAVRASTEEFFMVAEGAIPNTLVVDAWQWDGPGYNDTDVFTFRVKNSVSLEWSEFLVDGGSGAHVFKSKGDIKKMLKAQGIFRYKPYSFCRLGGGATVCFFVYDAILKRPAKIHDGSSIELGQLGYLQDDLGLPEDSPWRFDLDTYCDIIDYGDPELVIQPIIVDAYAPSANLVNEEDKAYYGGP